MEIKIGNQIWMTVNLNVDCFRNGDKIFEAKTTEEWIKAGIEGTPAWCHYNNNPSFGIKCGKLYNWYAVNDSRGLAPKNWDIASAKDWEQLIDFLGGGVFATRKLQSINYWENIESPNNHSGLNCLPCGSRVGASNDQYNGLFDGLGIIGCWWTSTEYNKSNSLYYYIDYDCVCGDYHKSYGFSVRCIKQ